MHIGICRLLAEICENISMTETEAYGNVGVVLQI